MTFYLKPPEGSIPVHSYQQFAETRLHFLITFSKKPEMEIPEILKEMALEIPRLDTLVEGTLKDSISHFALRSITMIDSDGFFHLVQNLEKRLFRKRLNRMKDVELDKGLRRLVVQLHRFVPHLTLLSQKSRRHETSLKRHVHFLNETLKVLLAMVKRRILFRELHEGSKFSGLQVPFTQVLPMLDNLEVVLTAGKARLINRDQIHSYLEIIFEKLIEVTTDVIKWSESWVRIQNDSRLQPGAVELRKIFDKYGIACFESFATSSMLTSSALNLSFSEIFGAFPLCMKNMYISLRRTHRLCHHPRIQFTLFLKSVGIPVDQVLQLLKQEYSSSINRSAASNHQCEHSWEKDGRRYTYGTRHLYGLEGSRKNYSSHTCSAIQSLSSYSACGGCPFQFSESRKLQVLIDDLGEESQAKEFLEQDRERFQRQIEETSFPPPIESCHEYLWFKLRKLRIQKSNDACPSGIENEEDAIETRRILIRKPIHFYRAIKSFT